MSIRFARPTATPALLALSVFAVSTGTAQPSTKPVRLQAPIAELTEPFGRVTGVRELPDGRVLVSDGPEKKLVVADFATQQVVQVGRNGNGPGEYAGGLALHPLSEDSTLGTDASTRRWLQLASGERLVAAGRGCIYIAAEDEDGLDHLRRYKWPQ